VQVGVVIDDKDYLSTIISSLPIALSNFASAQLAAARMFASTKSIEPEVLLSLLVEEANCQKAQQVRRRVSEKEGEDDDEALVAGADSSRFRRGKARADVECWGCGEKGHFKWQCKNLKIDEKSKDGNEAAGVAESDSEGEGVWAVEDDEVSIISRGASLVSPVFDDEDEMALVFKEVDDTKELDWFEGVMCGNEESAVTEPHKRDWFFEANKGKEKSDDELGNSSDVLVEGFGSEAPGGAIVMADAAMSSSIACIEAGPGDFKIAGHILVVCNSFNMGTHPFRAQAVPDVNLEGESGGMKLLLDMHGKPSDPDNTTMEWCNHAIALRAAEIEDIHPLGNRRGGEQKTILPRECTRDAVSKRRALVCPKLNVCQSSISRGRKKIWAKRRTYLPKTFLHPPQLFLSLKRAHLATNLCVRTRGSCCNL